VKFICEVALAYFKNHNYQKWVCIFVSLFCSHWQHLLKSSCFWGFHVLCVW